MQVFILLILYQNSEDSTPVKYRKIGDFPAQVAQTTVPAQTEILSLKAEFDKEKAQFEVIQSIIFTEIYQEEKERLKQKEIALNEKEESLKQLEQQIKQQAATTQSQENAKLEITRSVSYYF